MSAVAREAPPAGASIDLGSLELRRAKDLVRLKGLQREPSAARVRFLQQNWDEEKVGILHVARITDGGNAGAHHIYNGGSRWESKVKAGEENYVFRCWILDMTEQRAARAFLSENKDAMKPSAFARYAVGIHAGEESSLAIKEALDSFPLVPSLSRSTYGNGRPGEFAAFAAAERIVNNAFAESGDWPQAAEALRWSIWMGRETYPQHGSSTVAYGHDNDVIQAFAKIAGWNPLIVGDNAKEKSLRQAFNTWYGTPATSKLFEPLQRMTPPNWRLLSAEKGKSTGGSVARGTMFASLVVTNHNRAEHKRPDGVGQLHKPASKV